MPYVTSYYKKRWGFCLSENEKKKLPKGKYRVFIDSNFKNGNLKAAQAIIKAPQRKKFFLVVIFVIHQWPIMNYRVQSY